ncbi:hypothetical protein [aff. Roholtiella sp. LEGE 12411]|nr:hypothetical protein [aff. Roholtiella sp. LEGE 12411]
MLTKAMPAAGCAYALLPTQKRCLRRATPTHFQISQSNCSSAYKKAIALPNPKK